jgi:hypothetical protein
MGMLTVTGHADGLLSGVGESFQVGGSVDSFGSFGVASSRMSAGFQDYGGNGYVLAPIPGSSCGSIYSSTCSLSIDGEHARVDFTMTVPFEFGGSILVIQTADGWAATNTYGASVSDFRSTATFDSFILPDGAVLTSSAGPMDFSGGAWHYVPTAPVPEPETYAMLMAGFGVMGAVARRRKLKVA